MIGSGDLSCLGEISNNLGVDAFNANGNINLQMNCDSISIRIHSGTTAIALSGNVDHSYFYYFGNGIVDASELYSDHVHINWQSTGDLSTNVINSISGELKSSGDVFFSGSPGFISVSVTGSGQMVPQ